jgi:hypothetical protein
MKSPDDVCDYYSRKKVKIKIKNMGEFILIEGNHESLKFLSDLFAAQSLTEKDTGFQILPNGAGSKLFEKDSDMGIYIHKISDEGRKDD